MTAIAAVGQIQILSSPYSEIVSITELKTGRSLPFPSVVTTPYANDALIPGTYRIVLRCPAAAGKTVQRDVTVAAGATQLVSESFLSTDALMESLK